MKKINKKILVGIVIIVIIASIFLGITFSKYTTEVTGDGETEIAKWAFKVNESTEEFTTIKIADTYDKTTLLNGKIAPGTRGSFDLIVDATDAEVGVEYEVDFLNETNKPTNLKFQYDGKTLDNIEDFEQYFKGVIDANDNNKVRTLTVTWEWLYETGTGDEIVSNDKIDTQEGLSALDYTFDIVVTGTQVIPTK